MLFILFCCVYLYYAVFLEWENMCKAYVKAKAVIEKEGIPGFYIKSLAELEDFVQNVCFLCAIVLSFTS